MSINIKTKNKMAEKRMSTSMSMADINALAERISSKICAKLEEMLELHTDEFWSVDDVVKNLGLSVSFVYRYKEQLGCRKIHDRIFFSKNELYRLMRSGKLAVAPVRYKNTSMRQCGGVGDMRITK